MMDSDIDIDIDIDNDNDIVPMVGGRILGKGAYGCVFHPAPRCAGGTVFSKIGKSKAPAIGKIILDDDTITDELELGKQLMKLPNAEQFFALPVTDCTPKLPIQDPDIKSCDVLTDAVKKNPRALSHISMLVMPYGGKELQDYSRDLKAVATHFKSILRHLCVGAKLYQNAGYVHNDIHIGNILVDSGGVARFIDFGLAFKPATIRSWDDAHLSRSFKARSNYLWQPPEVLLWMMLMNNVPVVVGVKDVKRHNPELQLIENQFPSPNRRSFEGALLDLRSADPYFQRRDSVGFIKRYAKGFDAWRIGLTLWLVWHELLKWPMFRSWDGGELYADKDVRRVLEGLTDFDPRTRMTIVDACEILG